MDEMLNGWASTVNETLRENAALRDRIDALEWLLEVDDTAIHVANVSSSDGWGELAVILASAREAVGS